jgi:hypothetical protein
LGYIGKGDGEGEGMYREGGWKREGNGQAASCSLCPHHAGVSSSREGVLIVWGWTRRAGVFSLHGGVLVVQGYFHCMRVFSSCGHFSHPRYGTDEDIQFLELVNLESTPFQSGIQAGEKGENMVGGRERIREGGGRE